MTNQTHFKGWAIPGPTIPGEASGAKLEAGESLDALSGHYRIFQLKLEANADPSEEVMRLAMSRQWMVRELMRRRPTLEDVFVELTHSDS
jgi:hypothetical protein